MSKLVILWTKQFKKDYKAAIKRNLDIGLLDQTIRALSKGETLDPEFKDHFLPGNWKSCRECHITPDWLLIYKVENKRLVLVLARTGTQSDLSNK